MGKNKQMNQVLFNIFKFKRLKIVQIPNTGDYIMKNYTVTHTLYMALHTGICDIKNCKKYYSLNK